MDIPSYLLGRIKGSGGAGVSYIVVEELPTTGEEGKIYLVPKSASKTNNYYDEYMYINSEWEIIGDTEIDLSNYQELMQYAVVPNATSSIVGKIIQYTGATTQSYTNGYFYQCVSDGNDPATYSWTNINVDNLNSKQDTLISGVNIKTINNTSLLGSGNINISGDVSVVFINDFDTQAVKEEKYQQLIDNFKDGKESIIMYYKDSNNPETMVMTKFASAVNEQNEGYIAFKGFYFPNYQNDNYGIQYELYSNSNFYIYFANYVFTSASNFSGTVGLMPMSGSYSLGLYNTSEYTPTEDYNPATKKYVDDKVSNIKLITINNGETTTEKEEKYQQAIDNYKNGIETIIFFYYSGSNVRDEQPIVLKLEKVEESNGTGKITFSGYYMPNGTINWYGTNYTSMNDRRLIINFTNYVYTSASGQDLIKGYMITDYTNILGITNKQQWAPTGDYNPSTKIYTDKTHYENMTGYDATKTQVLKNINGTLTWVDEA